jgi:Leucine Rich Repeat (LRR) protein
LQTLCLDNTQVADLAPLAGLGGLQWLNLDNTQVADLAPLAGLGGLQTLYLNNTQVADLAPLAELGGLQMLTLDNTQVADLRPICDLPFPESKNDPFFGLHFKNTPAAASSPELTRLSEIEDSKTRTRETLAYLKTLPPWPEPLPWETKGGQPESGGSGPSQVAQHQIAFLLDHAAVSRVDASTTASQIRHALRNVPAQPGSNELPEIFQMTLNMATILDKTADSLGVEETKRETALQSRLAELEALVETLTAKLKDESARADAAEALAKDSGFWASYRKSTGTTLGVLQFAVAGTGLVAGAIYMLGSGHPAVRALLEALKITN